MGHPEHNIVIKTDNGKCRCPPLGLDVQPQVKCILVDIPQFRGFPPFTCLTRRVEVFAGTAVFFSVPV